MTINDTTVFKSYVDQRQIEEDMVPDLELSHERSLESSEDEGGGGAVEKRVRFRYDPRLVLPSQVYLTTEQVNAFVSQIQCDSLLLRAENGWPMSLSSFAERKEVFERRGRFEDIKVSGSHHCHLDPETREETASQVYAFLEKENKGENKEHEPLDKGEDLRKKVIA